MRDRSLRGIWLGRRRYGPIYELQVRLRDRRRAGQSEDLVLLLEHEPVVTLGRGGRSAHLLATPEQLAKKGVDLVETDRGGDITLHAPGQLVGYPLVDLHPDRCDVRRYVRDLASVMQRLVESHGIASGPVDGMVGLWVDADAPSAWRGAASATRLSKVGAIGVKISRWVTMHGFALNLTTDLSLFDLIVPCGISSHGVASVESLTSKTPRVSSEAARALEQLAAVLGAEVSGMEDWSSVGTGQWPTL